MIDPAVRMASDYNRWLAAPIRWVHVGAAVVRGVVGPIAGWMWHESRRAWVAPLALGIVVFIVLHPFDGALSRLLRGVPLRGDVRREIEAWQQYGSLGSVVFAAVVIWALDARRRRRLLDLVAAAGLVALACTVLKILTGRPRPLYGDARTILGPLGMYPVHGPDGSWVMRHAWGGGAGRAELWSMPSSHTGAAVALSVFLVALYPRLRGLGIVMVCVVGFGRLVTGAHWATDVAIGAIVGYAVAGPAVRGYWGVRAVDWVWVRFVDRGAKPAYPAMIAEERGTIALSAIVASVPINLEGAAVVTTPSDTAR